MDFNQIRITAAREHLDTLSAIMTAADDSIMVEDYSDILTDLRTVYGDLIDESLLSADTSKIAVSVFLPEDENPGDCLAFIRERCRAAGIEMTEEIIRQDEKDWRDAWKRYYHATKLGRIVVVPSWESYSPKEGETVVDMDPGAAFGTGTHETTRLCEKLLEDAVFPGCSVLDIGTGSGILAICAKKLGAGRTVAVDIDETAVRVARENCERNGCGVLCAVSDLLSNENALTGRYDVICANIVADVVKLLAPRLGGYVAEGGRTILSGIICEREDEVVSEYAKYGFKVVKAEHEKGWSALMLERR
ncbi:MAG: 50S ribosomal protein L11 methyltransferase [Clostridia bacterium]|nr:50S ribosomal protein L11 methyltransferase [Clostridia bacterium]